jgi:hypothetical protein
MAASALRLRSRRGVFSAPITTFYAQADLLTGWLDVVAHGLSTNHRPAAPHQFADSGHSPAISPVCVACRFVAISHRGTDGVPQTGRKPRGQTELSARRRATHCFLERGCAPWDSFVSPQVFAAGSPDSSG